MTTTSTPTMMALRAHARGGPEQLVYERAPAPVPGPGEALVQVRAGAITFAELTWDQTWTDRDGRDRTPTIPSHEVSGTVVGLGPGAGGGVGGAALDAAYSMTRRGGRLVMLAAPPDQDKAAALGLHATFFIVTPDAAELTRLAALVDAGTLRPVLSQTFPLRDGRKAFESAAIPHPPGKTVLVVAQPEGAEIVLP